MHNKLGQFPVVNIKSWEFNDIKMGHATTLFEALNTTYTAKNSNDTVRLHMGIRGDYRFKHGQLNRSFDLIGGHHNIMYSDSLDLEIINKSKEIETFGIEFPRQVFTELLQDEDDDLKKFCEMVNAGKTIIVAEKWGTITSSIQNVIDEIILNPYKSNLQKIFLFAKTLEILVLCIDNYKSNRSKTYHYLKNNADKEAIIAARDLINKNVAQPLGLSEIAKKVGINEFKLKYGFKEMFSTTLFTYLREKRLGLATQMIRDTEKSIASIADELGFSSPQHFSNHYKQRFGLSPKKVRMK